jgi:hypothetical protein
MKGITVDILELNDFEIVVKSTKELLTVDERACDWVKSKEKNDLVFPNLSSALKVKETENKKSNGFISVLNNVTNRVEQNEKQCSFLSSMTSNNTGFPVDKSNFYKAVTLFTARKSIRPTWLNMKDEYMVPKEDNKQWNQFYYDSIVYSIFNNRSYQSSLRQVEYKGKPWDIKNEFFWMSADKMKELADQKGCDELYNDARTSPDRYVHKLLFGEEKIYDKLSPDAKLVLDKATELVEKSMELRQVMANNENHLNSWDAGYAQLKLVWKEYFQEDFKEFRKLYKNLEDRMRPMVYELGFLKK